MTAGQRAILRQMARDGQEAGLHDAATCAVPHCGRPTVAGFRYCAGHLQDSLDWEREHSKGHA